MNSRNFDDDSVSRQDRAERWATLAQGQRISQDADWDITTPQLIALVIVAAFIGCVIGWWLFMTFPNPAF